MSWLRKDSDSGIWRYGWRENGRERYISLKTKKRAVAQTKQIAEDAARENGESILHVAKPVPVDLSDDNPELTQWQAAWEAYANHLRTNYQPSTVAARKWAWDHASRAFSPVDLSDCTPERIEAYKASWKADDKNGVTFNDLKTSMGAAYEWAIKKGYFVGVNPWKEIRSFRVAKKRRDILTVDDYDFIIQVGLDHASAHHSGGGHMVDDNVHVLFVLGLYFGMRKAEIAAARWEWFDWNSRTVTIYNDWGFSTKNGQNRSLLLFDQALKWIEPYRQPAGYLYRPEIDKMPKGAKYRTDFKKTFRAVWKAAQLKRQKEREANPALKPIPDMTTHLMRHSFCTNALKAGADVYQVADWVGHSSIYILETYRHAIPAKEAARKLFSAANA